METRGASADIVYATIDLSFGYQRALDVGTPDFNLLILNVFDEAYIGQISAGYHQQTASPNLNADIRERRSSRPNGSARLRGADN
jgi:iron complex outermembrane receptor protein